jgi:hypothetical protein
VAVEGVSGQGRGERDKVVVEKVYRDKAVVSGTQGGSEWDTRRRWKVYRDKAAVSGTQGGGEWDTRWWWNRCIRTGVW